MPFFGKVWTAAWGPTSSILLSCKGYSIGGAVWVVIKVRPEYTNRYVAVFINEKYIGENKVVPESGVLEFMLPAAIGSTVDSCFVEDCGLLAGMDEDTSYNVGMHARYHGSLIGNKLSLKWPINLPTFGEVAGNHISVSSVTGSKRNVNIAGLPGFPCRGRLNVSITSNGTDIITRFWAGSLLVAEGIGTGSCSATERNGSGLTIAYVLGTYYSDINRDDCWFDIKFPAKYEVAVSASALNSGTAVTATVYDTGIDFYKWKSNALAAGSWYVGVRAVDDEGDKATNYTTLSGSPFLVKTVPAAPTITGVETVAGGTFDVILKSGNSGDITLTLDAPSSLVAGQSITVALDPPDANYDGTHTITSVSGSEVHYLFGATDEVSTATAGTLTADAYGPLVEWTVGEAGCTYTMYASRVNGPINFGNLVDGPAPVVTALDATTALLDVLAYTTQDDTTAYDDLQTAFDDAVVSLNAAFIVDEATFSASVETNTDDINDAFDAFCLSVKRNFFDLRQNLAAQINMLQNHVASFVGEGLTLNEFQQSVGQYYGGFLSFLGSMLRNQPARYSFPNGALPDSDLYADDSGTGQSLNGVVGGSNGNFQSIYEMIQPLVKPNIIRIIVRATKASVQETTDTVYELELDDAGEVVQKRPNQATIKTVSAVGSTLTFNVVGQINEDNSEIAATHLDLYIVKPNATTVFTANNKVKVADVVYMAVLGTSDLQVGQEVTVALDPPDAEFDGTFTITGIYGGGSEFSYDLPGPDVGSTGTGGTITRVGSDINLASPTQSQAVPATGTLGIKDVTFTGVAVSDGAGTYQILVVSRTGSIRNVDIAGKIKYVDISNDVPSALSDLTGGIVRA